MISTSKRMYEARDSVRAHLMAKVEESYHNYPNVKYPNEVTRWYFESAKYDMKTSKAKIKFRVIKYRRKIAYTTQQNYQTYNHYSDVYATELKPKEISIVLDENNAEQLMNDEDPNIRNNAILIYVSIGITEFYPICVQKLLVEAAHKESIRNISLRSSSNQISELTSKINEYASLVSNSKKEIEVAKSKITKMSKSIDESIKNIAETSLLKVSVLKTLLSLGIYNPTKQLQSLNKKLFGMQNLKRKCENKANVEIKRYITNLQEYVDSYNKKADMLNEIDYMKLVEEEQYKYDLTNVKFPYCEGKPSDNPPKLQPEKISIKCEYDLYSVEKKDSDQKYDFVSFDDNSITQYYGLSLIALILIKNVNNGKYYTIMSNDAGSTINTIYKKSKITNKILIKSAQNGNEKIDPMNVYKVCVLPMSKRDEIIERYSSCVKDLNSLNIY